MTEIALNIIQALGYRVEQLGSAFVVVYRFSNNDTMRMVDKYFKTETGAKKALQRLGKQIGEI